MKKILLSLCMLLALTACKDDNKSNQQANAKPVVKIGASFPLTGNMSAIGIGTQKALVAAINDVNSNPNNKYYYELLIENDQMEPKLINNVANKFIYSDKVDVIVSFFSTAGRVVAPMAVQNKIINFNFGYSPEVLQSKYNFQNFTTLTAENDATIEFLKSKNVTNVDLLYQNIGAADQLLEPLKVLLDQNGISYTVHRFNKGERDFAMLVSKIKSSESQAVLIYAFEPEEDILTKEIRLQNVDKIIAYNDGLPMTNNYDIYEGYYNIGSLMTPQKYQKAWGLEGQNAAYTAYLYDTGKIIAEAYENTPAKGKIPTSDEVSAYLHSRKNYSGIVGAYIMDERGQFHSKGQVTIVKNGKLIPLDELNTLQQ
ncbi:MAG: ABC transporter substrate-binding protein [Alphaproteobacteria bacterium]|nr:ABC transporter substrate-binding protein [Alphaproteobacteria bacterium]